METLTPMMRQYQKIKENYKDAILFYRIGDFYEMFNDDAKIASKILEITLTSRDGGKEDKIPLAGVPHHSAYPYISRLIKEGYKVAICEQVEDPKTAKGVVKREVIRVITPGTVLESGLLDDSKNNFIISVSFSKNAVGFSFIDISTGEFQCAEFNDENKVDKLTDEIGILGPSECVMPESLRREWAGKIQREFPDIYLTFLNDWEFDRSAAYNSLINHFKTNSLKGFGINEENGEAISSAGALFKYVKDNQKTRLSQISKISEYNFKNYMIIDSAAQRNLEIIESQNTKSKKGSLLEIIDKTVTPMGRRKLRYWITHPLIKDFLINERLDAVEELLKKNIERDGLRSELSNILDIERIVSRLDNINIVTPRDLISLKESLKTIICGIKFKLEKFNSALLKNARLNIENNSARIKNIIALVDESIEENVSFNFKEQRIIKKGFNGDLDELLEIVSSGKDWVVKFENNERERSKIKSLKVRFNQIFGYYIEVSNPNLSQVPADYIRKQTLANCERFITSELKNYESKILSAEEKISNLQMELFKKVCESIGPGIPVIQGVSNIISGLDAILSLTAAAYLNNYVRPVINDGDKLIIKKGRHPVVEKIESLQNFVSNDTIMDTEENQILIITGPNMAGKSTYIRQVSLIVLMAQCGSFVPAESAEVGLVDRIFTRIGAMDNLVKGESTFLIEMNETANILNNATNKSLIILDEVGRGTSTFDGLSIAWSIVEFLHINEKIKARTLFATHYHELTELALSFKGVKNYNVAVREWNDEVIFLHQILPGGADKSYGIHVAQIAGLPKPVINRAKEILNDLEKNSVNEDGSAKIIKKRKENVFKDQMDLFLSSFNINHPIIEKLKSLDIKNLTPLDAINLLSSLQEEVKEKKH
ncbi:MAG: DNA mismatch repair protein MutS [bacterium]